MTTSKGGLKVGDRVRIPAAGAWLRAHLGLWPRIGSVGVVEHVALGLAVVALPDVGCFSGDVGNPQWPLERVDDESGA